MSTPTVVFLGDSITEESPWATCFPGVRAVNEGVGGERTYHLAARLESTISRDPAAVFLLVGINDLLGDLQVPAVVGDRTQELVERLQEACPQASLFLEALYPIRLVSDVAASLGPAGVAAQRGIRLTNERYREVAKATGVTFLDLSTTLSDDEGSLKSDYTNDGLHLTDSGYRATIEFLTPHVAPFARS